MKPSTLTGVVRSSNRSRRRRRSEEEAKGVKSSLEVSKHGSSCLEQKYILHSSKGICNHLEIK